MEMARFRMVFVVFVLFAVAFLSPVTKAECAGTTCGAICDSDYSCHVVTDSWSSMACKRVSTRYTGCVSMTSLLCCPRDPLE